MSEMLANQYFISGRYFEAFEEYSRLPKEKRDNLMIRKKMIISTTMNENFEKALSLLKELVLRDFSLFKNEMKTTDVECLCKEIVNKLEIQNKQKVESADKKKMQIAILNFFYNQDKSLEYFKKFEYSNYSDIVQPFLQSINSIKQ